MHWKYRNEKSFNLFRNLRLVQCLLFLKYWMIKRKKNGSNIKIYKFSTTVIRRKFTFITEKILWHRLLFYLFRIFKERNKNTQIFATTACNTKLYQHMLTFLGIWIKTNYNFLKLNSNRTKTLIRCCEKIQCSGKFCYFFFYPCHKFSNKKYNF